MLEFSSQTHEISYSLEHLKGSRVPMLWSYEVRCARSRPDRPGLWKARKMGKSWLEGKDKGEPHRPEPPGAGRTRAEPTVPPARAFATCAGPPGHMLHGAQGGRRNEGYPSFRIREFGAVRTLMHTRPRLG